MNDIVIIVILLMLFLIVWNSNEITTKKVIPCLIHNWGYDTNQQMYCKICKLTPGDLNE